MYSLATSTPTTARLYASLNDLFPDRRHGISGPRGRTRGDAVLARPFTRQRLDERLTSIPQPLPVVATVVSAVPFHNEMAAFASSIVPPIWSAPPTTCALLQTPMPAIFAPFNCVLGRLAGCLPPLPTCMPSYVPSRPSCNEVCFYSVAPVPPAVHHGSGFTRSAHGGAHATSCGPSTSAWPERRAPTMNDPAVSSPVCTTYPIGLDVTCGVNTVQISPVVCESPEVTPTPSGQRSRSNTPSREPPRIRVRKDQKEKLQTIVNNIANGGTLEMTIDLLFEWGRDGIADHLSSARGSGQSSANRGRGASRTTTSGRKPVGRPRGGALKWRDGKRGFQDDGQMLHRLTVKDHVALWDARARRDVVFLDPVKLLQILGMFDKSFSCGMTCTQLDNLTRGLGMRHVSEDTFYRFFRDSGLGSRRWGRYVRRVAEKSYNRVIFRLKSSNEPVVLLLDGRYDSSRDVQHCTVSAMELESRQIVGTQTLRKDNDSSWRLEKRCIDMLLSRLVNEKNLVIAEVVHDDCTVVDVLLRALDIDSQKCLWHKAKSLLKRLREAVRRTKLVKLKIVDDCEHVREIRMFTKKEFSAWLREKGLQQPIPVNTKKDTIVEWVWWTLFPVQQGKPLEIDVVEADALESRHPQCGEEVKEWFYGACKLRASEGDGDGEVLAIHVQHLGNHWAGDHSMCNDELSGLCKAAGGKERSPLYEKGGRLHVAIMDCLREFASATKMSFYTRARCSHYNECFHSIINKFYSKRLNFSKSYEARVDCAALDWNKNRALEALGCVYRKDSSVGHRRRSSRRWQLQAHDHTWRFEIARAVWGTPQVGDWARRMLQQEDLDDIIPDIMDADDGVGSATDDDVATCGIAPSGGDSSSANSDSEDVSSDGDANILSTHLDFEYDPVDVDIDAGHNATEADSDNPSQDIFVARI
ncbi:hypothetical protein CBR_g33915 [Chara braunii]|uniref:Uncharacterized protein n=1 Tax=Chara braunii TaxID=69332 RepID=A0A388LHE3_CHABU|nr:hypothetical protein CBR_g33915 [Chara braunii]|eukprot:GBG81736.1 hypothetical protein CBR_g33915 [Chara braunii]